MTGIDELDRKLISFVPFRTLTFDCERLPHRSPSPSASRAIGFLVSEKRINRYANLFALSRHDAARIMQERAADFRRSFGHENAGIRMAPHQDRKGPDVIEMGMRNNNGVENTIGQRAKVWQSFLAFLLRMHSAIENEPAAASLNIICLLYTSDA